jgi:hypothetical protein
VWRLDDAGDPVWPGAPVVASDSPTDRFRLEATDAGDEIYLVWTDASPPSNDIVAQNVTSDGSLGRDECLTDLSGDGVVDASDLAALIAGWSATGPTDLDGDGAISTSDLAALICAWGPCL